MSRLTADITELDRVLKHYGPEAQPVRTAAIQVSADLAQTQLALFAQPTDSISNTF